MKEWLRVMGKALASGERRPDRTGHGTLSLFGEQLRFDNSSSFPAVTTKRLAFGQVAAELACFLRGHQDLEDFHALGCRIWDANASAPGWAARRGWSTDLGRIYGVQWRRWLGRASPDGDAVAEVDQLRRLVDGIRRDPFGRRHLVTAWNPAELEDVCLPPCHVLFQCYVRPAGTARPGDGPAVAEAMHLLDGREHDFELDLRVDMRSVDLFLGLPFDVASYALLQRLLCRELGQEYRSGRLVFHLGDAHVYLNHLEQAREVLRRAPMGPPGLWLHPSASLFEFDPGHAGLREYDHHPSVPAPMNV